MRLRIAAAAPILLLAAWSSACTPKPATTGGSLASPAPVPAAGVVAAAGGRPVADPIALPGAADGIGFDDLGWAPKLGRVLVPAGRSGKLDLIDPATKEILSVGGFGAELSFKDGHGTGVTSADEGLGVIFAIDRTRMMVDVVDPARAAIVASTRLGASPDYVRFVASTRELWVTEPEQKRIEIFSLSSDAIPVPKHAAFIAVAGGPESLVVDGTRGRAWTHLWTNASLGIDLRTRAIVERLPNGCEGSRGIALDEKRGWLFVACEEGRAVVLDLAHGGKALGSLAAGAGIDVIAYDPGRRHLYLPGADSATLTFAGVGETGSLTRLGAVETARGAHCVATDLRGGVWVCDPNAGRLLRFDDVYP